MIVTGRETRRINMPRVHSTFLRSGIGLEGRDRAVESPAGAERSVEAPRRAAFQNYSHGVVLAGRRSARLTPH